MTTYEYTTLTLPTGSALWVDLLNQYGALGWRVVQVTKFNVAVLERPTS